MSTNNKPNVPPRIRTVTYFVLLAVGALALFVGDVSAIWLAEDVADKIGRTADSLVGVAALIGGGLGVTYRPTRKAPETGAQDARIGR